MKIRTLALLISLSIFGNCNSKQENKPEPLTDKQVSPDFKVALQFINDYTKFCLSSTKGKISDTSWVNQNSLLTQNFKNRYKAIIDSAWRADKELGLDSDPIFDAQDFPDKGFSILKTDTSGGYVTLIGNEWKEFELNLRVLIEGNKSLVDGAGIINIPTDKKAKR